MKKIVIEDNDGKQAFKSDFSIAETLFLLRVFEHQLITGMITTKKNVPAKNASAKNTADNTDNN